MDSFILTSRFEEYGMCKGCPEFLEQKKPVFTRAAMLQVKKRWIEPQDHNDIVQSAYLKALERKAIDPKIVSKPNSSRRQQCPYNSVT